MASLLMKSLASVPRARYTSNRSCTVLSKQIAQCQAASSLPPSRRPISTSSQLAYPRKDSQDKDSINTEATEYSKSGTDDEGARQEAAAFDPNITDPHEQKGKAGEGTGDKNNPLEVSPANPEVSKQRHPQEGGAENSGDSTRQRSSGGSSPSKGSKVT